MDRKYLLEVNQLKMHFPIGRKKVVKAVDGISFSMIAGETLGLVGESGCGKTTVGRVIARMYTPTSGNVFFDGKNIFDLNNADSFEYTKKVQMIFQDPYASLNPRMTILDIIGEGMDIHNLYIGKEREERIYYLLQLVGLTKEHASRFPHEFSGGQRQRVGIARSLAINPELIVCDEPISALDVSIQAQIVNLLDDLQQELGLTYLFIAHDLSMVKYISDKIIVMYLGIIVETAECVELTMNPLHPYTKALISSVPIADPQKSRNRVRIKLTGEVPSPINSFPGCVFYERCYLAGEICKTDKPELSEISPRHFAACHKIGVWDSSVIEKIP